jgi:hypothetical protein
MPKPYAARTGRDAVRYRIVVRGTIGQPLAGPAERMRLEPTGEDTALVGDIVDQAQLQGVIGWLSALGVEIVSINPLGEPPGDP